MEITESKNWAEAKKLLVHYFKLTAKKNGRPWDDANAHEIEEIIESIRDGVLEELKQAKKRKPGKP